MADNATTDNSNGSNTVILGAGIIGLSTAYYLSQSGYTNPQSIHLVDTTEELFYCSSGFAGGFLAADWFAPSSASLGILSFQLHKQLAESNNGRKIWGYSRSTGISYSQDTESAIDGSGEDWLSNGTSRAQAAGTRHNVESNRPVWLKEVDGASLEVISHDRSTAQIDPLRFCRWMLEQCLQKGVQLHQPAKVTSINTDGASQLNGVRIQKGGVEAELPCTRIIITSGAWAPRTFASLFPKASTRIPIAPLAGHSLLLKNPFFKELDEEEMCHAIFATDTLGFSPEWFSRAGGEVYLAGLNSTQIPLPDQATEVKCNPEAIQQMKECAKAMMGTVDNKELESIRESLCFRPVTSSGRPIVARIPDEKLGAGIKTRPGKEGGVFVAAGHGAWGISQAPGTGLCLAELVEGREPSANLSALVLPA
ncbi:FAD dependent oxidoreductase [Aaosphaeria arxii CBS 175.79]|uniref:FAD dependent oxidoreductase n=1 Tax=Aaosphaeria arxii CBS 175.79 TaxID=1450172 RepID=A0A6A5Y319_9PLEO|nr:FAD dependent oxidoreductase [Aaosphaeria arxii CBS 175.79]KAF2019636.1 FAD dependent oxidoreductase [Aaosphaeria arxii CBS 175.79]